MFSQKGFFNAGTKECRKNLSTTYPKALETNRRFKEIFTREIEYAKQQKPFDDNNPFKIIIGGKVYTDKEEAAKEIRAFDKDAIIHYQGANNAYYEKILFESEEEFVEKTTPFIDIHSEMYTQYHDLIDMPNRVDKRPMFLCEYSHAMGNSCGAMHKYTDLTDEEPLYQGGFIWDFADQGIEIETTHNGEKINYIAYGGDFGEKLHDGNFCVDGLVNPDRKLHTGMLEVKQAYRPVDFKMSKEDLIEMLSTETPASRKKQMICSRFRSSSEYSRRPPSESSLGIRMPLVS